MKFPSKLKKKINARKCIQKYNLQNGGHIAHNSMCLLIEAEWRIYALVI